MASTHRSHDSEDTVFMADSATTLPLPAKRVSWGAVIAGMVIAVVVQLVLSLLGAGVGLGAFDPLGYSSPDASTFGISAAIWWAISSVVALFVGGWVAGHLCGSLEKTDAVLHGLLTWGVGTIVTVYLITAMVSSVVRGGAAVIGKAASIATSGAVAGSAADPARSAVPGGEVSAASLRAPTAALLAPAAAASSAEPDASPASAAASGTGAASASAGSTAPAVAVKPILQRILASGRDTVDPADRDALVDSVAARTGVPRAEAEQRVDAWVRQYQEERGRLNQQKAQSEAKARQAADDAASASAKGALGAAAALVLGAIAGALGGMAGRRRPRVFVASTTPVAR